MQTVKQAAHSLIDKLQRNELGTLSRTGNEMSYPSWLRDFFALMSATYGGLWNEQFLDAVTTEAIKRVWYIQLKDYEPEVIQLGMIEAAKMYRFPPKPAELIEILQSLRRQAKSREDFRIMEEKRLLPAPPRLPPTREVLEAKLKMWQKLGMGQKAKEVEDVLTAMDLQKE